MTDMNETIMKTDRRGRLRYTEDQKQAHVGGPTEPEAPGMPLRSLEELADGWPYLYFMVRRQAFDQERKIECRG